MRKLAIAAVAFVVVAAATPVVAADMALKAPPPAPSDPWAGWYIGANVGGSFGRATDTSTYAGGVPFGATSSRLDGILGGGQIGYNWQSGSWVLGLEADIQGTGERGSAPSSQSFIPFATFFIPPVTGTLSDTEKLPWFGTARGRIGIATAPGWLLYATGGLAYGQIDSATTFTQSGVSMVNNFHTTRAGWTAGAGVEAWLGHNWTAKLEYLYLDFGSFSNTFTAIAPFTPMTLTSHVTDNVVRVGLNYHFSPSPAVANY
jgi:outer membrane immunogenic protein